VDGGISDNFAIDLGEKMGEKVLGIVLESNSQSFSNDPDIGVLEFIYKLIFVPIAQATEYKIQQITQLSDKCRIIRIKHESKVKFFQFDLGHSTKLEMFSMGYRQMREKFE
jgi:predicted patatin/cPLA2 family phospholipase